MTDCSILKGGRVTGCQEINDHVDNSTYGTGNALNHKKQNNFTVTIP